MASFHSLYGLVVFHWVYAPHLLYPIVSGHLTCFHILSIVTSSALSFQFTAFSQDMSRSGIAESWGSLVFEEPSSYFPYREPQFILPTTVFKHFFISTSLPAFICVLVDGYFGRCQRINSVGVDLHFFDDYRCKASFPVPVCHLYISFAKNVYWYNWAFLNKVLFFFVCFSIVWILYIF